MLSKGLSRTGYYIDARYNGEKMSTLIKILWGATINYLKNKIMF